MFYSRLLLSALVIGCSDLWAAAAASSDSVVRPVTVSGTGYVGQVLFGLLAVLLLIAAIAWLVKRFGQGGFLANPHMKVVATLPLGPRERLAVVDMAGQQILLGISSGRITNLHTFDEPLVPAEGEAGRVDFADKLREIMQGNVRKESSLKAEEAND